MDAAVDLCDEPSHIITVNINNKKRELQTAKNPWKSSFRNLNSDEIIIRKMRAILNKLTPDNFEKLTVQITKFKIVEFNTFDKIIHLIFEKAIYEELYTKIYADLCKVLSQLSIKVKSEKEKEGGEARFRNLLINKCQQEFEKDNSKDLQKEERLKKIAEAIDPEHKAELKAQLEYDDKRLRKRSVGNIIFIGELYKNRMMTSSIMMRIICGLLSKQDEESLECLCKLVSTIGYMLEPQSQVTPKAQAEFSELFNTLGKIVDERKTSNRIRFIIMDLIDQRKNQWVGRREFEKPMKISELHEKIRKEKLEQHYPFAAKHKQGDQERKKNRNPRGKMTVDDDDDAWNTFLSSRRSLSESSRLKKQTFNREGELDSEIFSSACSITSANPSSVTPYTRNNETANMPTSLTYSNLTQKRAMKGNSVGKTEVVNSSVREIFSSLKQDDFQDQYGKQIANKLHTLTEDQRILVKKLFNDVLVEAEMGRLTKDFQIVNCGQQTMINKK